MSQTYTSAATSINSAKAPAVYGLPSAVGMMTGRRVIDIGGGRFDTAQRKAAEYGAAVAVYDPYNRTEAHNKEVLRGAYDVAVVSNVLNVIDSAAARSAVLQLAAEKAPVLLVTVYEGDKSGIGRQTGPDAWQENRLTCSYVQEVQSALGGAWTVQRQGKLIVAKRG